MAETAAATVAALRRAGPKDAQRVAARAEAPAQKGAAMDAMREVAMADVAVAVDVADAAKAKAAPSANVLTRKANPLRWR